MLLERTKMNYKQTIILLILGLLLNACLPGTNNTTNVSEVDSNHILDIDSTRRVAYVKAAINSDEVDQICAEPAPDTALQVSLELLAKLETPQVAIETGAKANQELVELLGRSSTLLIQREALYRLCELYTNKKVQDNGKIIELYEDILNTTKIIAVTELLRKMEAKHINEGNKSVFELIVKALANDSKESDIGSQ